MESIIELDISLIRHKIVNTWYCSVCSHY